MRCLAPTCVLLLVALGSGCQHTSPCHQPCPPADAAPCPAPEAAPGVEVKAPQEIRVKAPPQKITVTLPPGYGEPAPAPAPGYSPAPGYAPQPQAGYGPTPNAMMTGATQSVSRPHSRIALGFDFFHLPIPYPKLFAMPAEQEIVTRQTYQAAPAPAPAPVYAPAPVFAPPPPQYAPVYPAPAPMYAPVPAPAPAPAAHDCDHHLCPKGPVLNHLNHLHDKLDCLKQHLKSCEKE